VPAAFGRLAEWAGSLRARVARMIPDLGARRAFWERILRGPAADLAMAGDTQAADHELDRALLGGDRKEGGFNIIVIPAAPDLLMLRDLRVLQNADVIRYPAGIDTQFLDFARRDAEHVASDTHSVPSAYAETGKRVVCFVAANAVRGVALG